MNASILNASVNFIEQPFLKPLQISSGSITKATEARVSVTVRADEHESIGFGSIYLSDLWAWPGTTPSREAKDKAMRGLCEEVAANLFALCGGEAVHPLELGLRLHHSVNGRSAELEMPSLACSVCASPFDAAIHDAVGNALGISAFRFYEVNSVIPSADRYFFRGSAQSAIRETLRKPIKTLNAWWLVSAGDDLESFVRPAVEARGIHCFKIKTLARNNAGDANRISEIFQAAKSWGIAATLSIDSNEGNPSAASVLDFLECLEALDPAAYRALIYLEQPTSRDIVGYPQDWRLVAARKPVLLDEGLTSLDLLPLVRQQYWSGLALKTCKGHSLALVAAAWAKENNLTLSLQDLTNPGFSAVHAFLFGAHVATMNGVELNSPQYTPNANLPWLPALSGLFEPRQGVHSLDSLHSPGLGSSLVDIS